MSNKKPTIEEYTRNMIKAKMRRRSIVRMGVFIYNEAEHKAAMEKSYIEQYGEPIHTEKKLIPTLAGILGKEGVKIVNELMVKNR